MRIMSRPLSIRGRGVGNSDAGLKRLQMISNVCRDEVQSLSIWYCVILFFPLLPRSFSLSLSLTLPPVLLRVQSSPPPQQHRHDDYVLEPMAPSIAMSSDLDSAHDPDLEPQPEAEPTPSVDDDALFDHFDADGNAVGFSPLPASMAPIMPLPPMSMLPPMQPMPEHGSQSVPASFQRAVRSQSSSSGPANRWQPKSNLLRPKSTAMWASNDIDELHEEMSNQLQHLVTHSMSLDGKCPTFLKAVDSVDSDATDSAEADPDHFGHHLSPQQVPQHFGHSYSRSMGDLKAVAAVQGTDTPKNLCSPQTADQWDDAELDRQAEEIRLRLEQYRMD